MATVRILQEECNHSYDKKCHTSYSTEYEAQQEEECDDNYNKECDITYSPQAQNVTVRVCMTPLVKVGMDRRSRTYMSSSASHSFSYCDYLSQFSPSLSELSSCSYSVCAILRDCSHSSLLCLSSKIKICLVLC